MTVKTYTDFKNEEKINFAIEQLKNFKVCFIREHLLSMLIQQAKYELKAKTFKISYCGILELEVSILE